MQLTYTALLLPLYLVAGPFNAHKTLIGLSGEVASLYVTGPGLEDSEHGRRPMKIVLGP